MFDFGFRPKSYWGELDKLLSNIKGQWRRTQIKNSILKGEVIPQEILQDSLSEVVREFTGRIHPSLMGGEYLPNYKIFEVEIARVVYKSTTGDVMSIRAKLGKNRIYYRIVDEYNMDWVSKRKSSIKPLTLKQIVELILSSYVETEDYPYKMLIEGTFFCNYLWGWEGKEVNVGFMSVESEFYPQLYGFFDQLEGNWLNFCDNYYKDEKDIDESDNNKIFKLACGDLLDL